MQHVEVLAAGFATTVQDIGRTNYQALGFPESGALDFFSHRLANLLVANDAQAATLEFAWRGPTLHFSCATFIAITGGNSQPELNGVALELNRAYLVSKGDILRFKQMLTGRWGYLAVAAGGFLTPTVLGSRSTTVSLHLGGIQGRFLSAGDSLPIRECVTLPSGNFRTSVSLELPVTTAPMLHFIKGPQWEWFSMKTQLLFEQQAFQVSPESNRMGYRLAGANVAMPAKEMLSAGTVLGNIQVTPSGQPILLLADRQTVGGYPVIGTLIRADLPRLVQLNPKQTFYLRQVSLEEAVSALQQQINFLSDIEQLLLAVKGSFPVNYQRVMGTKISKERLMAYQKSGNKMEMAELTALMELFAHSKLTQLEWNNGVEKIRMNKNDEQNY